MEGLTGFFGVFASENAGGILRAEVQLPKFIDSQVKQIKRLPRQAALAQFVRHDSADALDVQRGAGGEELDPARGLGGALDVFASPGDEFGVAPDRAAANRAFSREYV